QREALPRASLENVSTTPLRWIEMRASRASRPVTISLCSMSIWTLRGKDDETTVWVSDRESTTEKPIEDAAANTAEPNAGHAATTTGVIMQTTLIKPPFDLDNSG